MPGSNGLATVGAWEQLEYVQLLCPKVERLPDSVGDWRRVRLAAFGPIRSVFSLPAGDVSQTSYEINFHSQALN